MKNLFLLLILSLLMKITSGCATYSLQRFANKPAYRDQYIQQIHTAHQVETARGKELWVSCQGQMGGKRNKERQFWIQVPLSQALAAQNHAIDSRAKAEVHSVYLQTYYTDWDEQVFDDQDDSDTTAQFPDKEDNRRMESVLEVVLNRQVLEKKTDISKANMVNTQSIPIIHREKTKADSTFQTAIFYQRSLRLADQPYFNNNDKKAKKEYQALQRLLTERNDIAFTYLEAEMNWHIVVQSKKRYPKLTWLQLLPLTLAVDIITLPFQLIFLYLLSKMTFC